MKPYYESNGVEIYLGDCREVMPQLDLVHAIITDPPYEIGFMGKKFDKTGVAHDPAIWKEALRVLRPGGHLLAFGGTRTYHRLACAIEDAGFEARDVVTWLYSQGFPKNLNVSLAIDKAAGANRETIATGKGRTGEAQPNGSSFSDDNYCWPGNYKITAPATDAAKQWEGYGTALKPAMELICVARKPLVGTVAANVLEYGTGAMNIDGCRVKYLSKADKASATPQGKCTAKSGALAGGMQHDGARGEFERPEQKGRWPANVILSFPSDHYQLRSDITDKEKGELFRWLSENS